MVLLRFAPSPTGALHLGGLRTALLNHILARKWGGKWILRIEDTDTSRYIPGSVDNIRHALDWAGLHYDYGPGRDGPHGPYFQSQRLDLYHNAAGKLLETRHAYRCFCSPESLSQTRDALHKRGSNATYDRKCLYLTDEEVARRVKNREKSVIRLHDASVPARSSPSDLIFGEVRDASLSLPTDPILLKSDMYPTYHLASVVDDSQMGITHVIRGEEWLPSLPLHLNLYSCLSIPAPGFAHLPLLLNPDGSKMSKRTGDVQAADYIAKGWEPEALVNWLALVGWGNRSGDSQHVKLERGESVPDVFTLPDLISKICLVKFELSALTTRRAVLEPSILPHLNKEHIKLKAAEPQMLTSLSHKAAPIVSAAFPNSDWARNKDYIKCVISTLEERLTNLFDIPALAPYFFLEPDLSTDVARKLKESISSEKYELSVSHCIRSFQDLDLSCWKHDELASCVRDVRKTLSCTSKELMTPLRHALTGMKDGPSIISTIVALGKERTLHRLKLCAGNGLGNNFT